MINGKRVSIDFSSPEIYTDEYAKDNADTEEFKFIKDTPVYKHVRKSLSINIPFENALSGAVSSLISPMNRIAEQGFNVIEYEDGTQNISDEAIKYAADEYKGEVDSILETGGVAQEQELKEWIDYVKDVSSDMGSI